MIVYMDHKGNYPRHAGDVKLVDASWEPGQPLPEGWKEVQIPDVIPTSKGHKTKYGPAEEINGILTATYILEEKESSTVTSLADIFPEYQELIDLKQKTIIENQTP